VKLVWKMGGGRYLDQSEVQCSNTRTEAEIAQREVRKEVGLNSSHEAFLDKFRIHFVELNRVSSESRT